jgi:hypothetical protein
MDSLSFMDDPPATTVSSGGGAIVAQTWVYEPYQSEFYKIDERARIRSAPTAGSDGQLLIRDTLCLQCGSSHA